MKRVCIAWMSGAALLLVAQITLAQAYPVRPIRIVVPFRRAGLRT